MYSVIKLNIFFLRERTREEVVQLEMEARQCEMDAAMAKRKYYEDQNQREKEEHNTRKRRSERRGRLGRMPWRKSKFNITLISLVPRSFIFIFCYSILILQHQALSFFYNL